MFVPQLVTFEPLRGPQYTDLAVHTAVESIRITLRGPALSSPEAPFRTEMRSYQTQTTLKCQPSTKSIAGPLIVAQ